MRHKIFTLLITMIVASLFIASCAPTQTPVVPVETQAPVVPTETQAPVVQAETQAPAVPTTPPTTVPVAQKRVFRESFSWPDRIDPAVGNDFVSATSLANLYDSLVFPNAKGLVDPWLATSWDISTDGMTYTFHLRSGVKFHDGSLLKASDVVYSYNRITTIGEGYGYLFIKKGIKSVSAPDDSTVVFTIEKPSALFLPSLVRLYIASEAIVKAHTETEGPYGENGDYGKAWLQTNDAGSGPYMVKEFPLEQYLLMEKFTDWWGKFNPNAPDEAKFLGTTEPVTIRTLMENHELEVTDQWQTLEAYGALAKIEGVKVAPIPTLSAFYYMINNKKPPTDDVHCRKAIDYGFNYQESLKLEWPGVKQMIAPVPATLAGVDTSIPYYTYDIDKAKAELAQCKYANDLANNPIIVQWVSEVPDEEKYALLFLSDMAALGFKVEVQKVPWLSLVENTSKLETSPSIATIYVTSDLPEAGLMYQQRYSSGTAGTWQQNEWLQDPALDAKISDALSTIDQTARFTKYSEIQKELEDRAVSLWIYDQIAKHAYRTCVDLPVVRGETSHVEGYYFFLADIGVDCP